MSRLRVQGPPSWWSLFLLQFCLQEERGRIPIVVGVGSVTLVEISVSATVLGSSVSFLVVVSIIWYPLRGITGTFVCPKNTSPYYPPQSQTCYFSNHGLNKLSDHFIGYYFDSLECLQSGGRDLPLGEKESIASRRVLRPQFDQVSVGDFQGSLGPIVGTSRCLVHSTNLVRKFYNSLTGPLQFPRNIWCRTVHRVPLLPSRRVVAIKKL